MDKPLDTAALRRLAEEGGWRSDMENAPRDGWIMLGKIVGHPSHPTALWWIVKGEWSEKYQCWWDGIEPSGLAGPNCWMPLPSTDPDAPSPSPTTAAIVALCDEVDRLREVLGRIARNARQMHAATKTGMWEVCASDAERALLPSDEKGAQ
jgi:hypothetical protein